MINIIEAHKRFNINTINEVYALKGINLNIKEGDWVTIIGTNGSGKSTLLNAVAGSFILDSGKIIINKKDVTSLPDFKRSRNVSRVFQNPFMGTAPNMTIAENLHLANLRGEKRFPKVNFNKNNISNYQEKIKQLEMQLEDRLNNVIGSLSGGQRQSITLLMAIMKRPDVLLLDEHTAALDPKTANQVIKLTRKFVEKDQLTAVMVTHSMQQALELGNRTIMMNNGEIIADLDAKTKKGLVVNDLLDRFADLRKEEKLSEDMLNDLRKEYL